MRKPMPPTTIRKENSNTFYEDNIFNRVACGVFAKHSFGTRYFARIKAY